MSVQRETEDPERAEGIASESRSEPPSRLAPEGPPAKDSAARTDAPSPAEGLRDAVEWLSVKDTRRMVKHGSPSALYRSILEHRPDKPMMVSHYRVIAETNPAEVLTICDLVEQEGTSGPNIFALIDARKQGRVLVRPHDDEPVQ